MVSVAVAGAATSMSSSLRTRRDRPVVHRRTPRTASRIIALPLFLGRCHYSHPARLRRGTRLSPGHLGARRPPSGHRPEHRQADLRRSGTPDRPCHSRCDRHRRLGRRPHPGHGRVSLRGDRCGPSGRVSMFLLLGSGGEDASGAPVRLPSADGEDAQGHDGAVVVEGARSIPSAGSGFDQGSAAVPWDEEPGSRLSRTSSQQSRGPAMAPGGRPPLHSARPLSGRCAPPPGHRRLRGGRQRSLFPCRLVTG